MTLLNVDVPFAKALIFKHVEQCEGCQTKTAHLTPTGQDILISLVRNLVLNDQIKTTMADSTLYCKNPSKISQDLTAHKEVLEYLKRVKNSLTNDHYIYLMEMAVCVVPNKDPKPPQPMDNWPCPKKH